MPRESHIEIFLTTGNRKFSIITTDGVGNSFLVPSHNVQTLIPVSLPVPLPILLPVLSPSQSWQGVVKAP